MKKRFISILAILSILAATLCFALPAGATEAFDDLNIFKTENGYLVEAEGTVAPGASYWMIGAGYDTEKNALQNVKVTEVTAPQEGGSTTLSAAFSTGEIAGDESYFMLWKRDGGLIPMIEKYPFDVAAEYPALTEIAEKMPVGVTTEELCGTNPKSLVDGDATTLVWTAEEALMYVDLGRPMPVEMIEILTYRSVQPASASFDVYAMNEVPTLDVPADKKVKLGTTKEQASAEEGYQTFAGNGEAYRYISLEKFGGEYDTEDQEEHMTVYDLKVYIQEENMVELTEVAAGKKNGLNGQTGYDEIYDALTDGKEETCEFLYNSTGNMYVDLGTAYKIDHIEVVAYYEVADLAFRTTYYNVCLTNEPPTEDTSAENKAVIAEVPYGDGATTAADGRSTYYPTADVQQTPYRYVSLEKFHSTHGLMINEVKVYVRTEDMPQFVEVAAGKKNGLHGVTGLDENYEALTDGKDETYEFIYNSAGNMYVDLGMGYKIDHIEILAYAHPDVSFRTTYYDICLTNELPTESTAADKKALVASLPYGDGANTAETGLNTYYPAVDVQKTPYRYVSLEKFHSTHGLMINEVKVYVRPEDMPKFVEVAAGKGGAEAGVNTWDFDNDTIWTESSGQAINRLTDGNEGTSWSVHGGGNHAMGAIDLGQKYKIAKVEVLAYNGVDPNRGANFDIALSNVIPTSPEAEDTYTNGKLTLGTMPYRDDRTSAATGYDTFQVDYTAAGADAEGYQYVCLEEMTDGVTYVAEVKVYVLEEDMPVVITYEEVAAGKGGAEAGANTWDFDKDTVWTESNNWAINRLTDGDENTSWAVHGGGNHAMGAIDLGQKYKIAKVEVLAYSATDPSRGANFDIALSNVIPTSPETEDTYTNGKLTLGTMPYRDDRTSAATGYDTFTVDYTAEGTDAEGYQYVCLEELTDGVTYVAEVKVYIIKE